MPIIVRKKFEAELVDFLIDTYFKGDVKAFSAQVLSTENQIAGWRSGRVKPQKWQLRSMLSHTLVPEIKVVAEYQRVEFKTASDVSQLMRQVLQGHLNTPGIYAFYDSMWNVIYVGKASEGLFGEICQQLRGGLGVKFPRAVREGPKYRWQAVQYVSAYEVPKTNFFDYQKHIEALILRVSKPVSNKVLGTLQNARAKADT